MLKNEFVGAVSKLSGLTDAQVRAVLNSTQIVARDTLVNTGEVKVPGLVSLKIMARSERAARNPKTGEPHMVKAGHTVKARPVSTLSNAVEKEFI